MPGANIGVRNGRKAAAGYAEASPVPIVPVKETLLPYDWENKVAN